MKMVYIIEAFSINADLVESVFYPAYNVRTSRSSHSYETIQKKIDYARRYNRFFDFTNERDKIKSLLLMTDGNVYATSLTREKIEDAIANKRKPKTKSTK